jgi:hypothetical protein
MRFDVLGTVSMKITVIWDMTPCSLVDGVVQEYGENTLL